MLTANMSEYAPTYTKKERIIYIGKMLAWIILLYLVTKLWLFDWFAEYAAHANCCQYGNITGVHLIVYGLFVFLPVLFAAVIILLEGKRSIKILKLGQNPLPNEKVLFATKYKYGISAKIKPIGIVSCILFLFALSVWGAFQAYAFTENIKPCAADNSLQSRPQSAAPKH